MRNGWQLGVLASASLLDGCAGLPREVVPPTAVTVAAAVAAEPSLEDGAEGVAIWRHPADPSRSLVLGAAGTSGLEAYGLDGRRRQVVGGLAASRVTVLHGLANGAATDDLVLVADAARGAITVLALDATGRLRAVPGAELSAGDEITGLCSYRSALTGDSYALAITDAGLLLQWQLYADSGAVRGRLVRRVPLGKGAAWCTVDDAGGMIWYADEGHGVFALAAEPEADTQRQVVALLRPFGPINGEPKGLAFIARAGGKGWLVVADADAEQVLVLTRDGALLGRIAIGPGNVSDGVGESEGIAVATLATGPGFPEGVLAIADQDNAGGHSNYKLVSWRDIRAALALPATVAAKPHRPAPLLAATVRPRVQTPPTESYGDAADDPSIWVQPDAPEQSLVIGTDKKLGLYVYDLDGRLLQTVPDGRMNNVDLRDGLVIDGQRRTLVAASNRTTKSIALYLLDAAARRLEPLAAAVPTGFDDPYGLCLYASARGGVFVFVNDAGSGRYRQWRIGTADGQLGAELVREFTVGSQAEGCVADDETGALFVAEEAVGLWRYSAEPDGGDARVAIDRVGGAAGLVADLEGIGIWRAPGGSGYLVLSNQGADNYAVYRREPPHQFVGTFNIVADPAAGIDGVSETDGLEVTSQPLGPAWPRGLLIVQDGRNLSGDRQNFKYVDWAAVAAALGLRDEG